MQFMLGLTLAAGLLLLAGCVVTSVYPYFTAKDVLVDELLAGKWSERDEADEPDKYWQFSGTNGQAYMLVVREAEESTEYRAHLFKLGAKRFIDAQPTARESDFIPPHYLLQVHKLEANTLQLSVLSYKWMEELVEHKPSVIEHVWVDRDESKGDNGRLVLTADTATLQKFVRKYAPDTNAFAETFDMIRK